MIDKKYYDFIQEEVFTGHINGLKVNIIPKRGYSKSFASLTTKYGSKNIEFAVAGGEMKKYPMGIAHFLEHKLFEEKDGNVFERFAQLGAAPNAYTNFQVTSYYFTCTEGYEENLALLIKFVFNPYFTEENVNKEKGIIEQEIRMYDDNPGFKVYFNALANMYENNPIKYDIAGTVESIYKITPELLYECYNTFYIPDNMVLTIVGDIDVESTCKIIKDIVPADKGKSDFVLQQYTEGSTLKEKFVKNKMGLSIPNFILGFKDSVEQQMDEMKWLERKVQMDILGKLYFAEGSPVYDKLYKSALINESFSYEYSLEMDYAHMIMGGESQDPKKVQGIIQDYIKEEAAKKVNEEDFNRMKKVLVGSFISRFNSIEGLGNFFSNYNIRGVDPLKYFEVLKAVQAEKIQQRLKILSNVDGWMLSVVD